MIKQPSKLIEREIFKKITPWLKKEKILILKGARQVGKTTLLKQLQRDIKEKFPQDHIIYLAADDLENQDIFSSTGTLETYISRKIQFPVPRKFVFLFIDEFQYIKQAGQFLKNIFDKYKGLNNLQIIVSGSSSLEITKNQEFLTGRALEFMVERINFREFFSWKNNVSSKLIKLSNFKNLENFYKAFKFPLNDTLKEYVTYGGYPEVITTATQEKKEIVLSSIIKNYIEKDIVGFLKIENVNAFNKMLTVLSEQIGNMVNISELANSLGLSVQTIKKYLNIIEGTYVFHRLAPYYRNIRKEITKMPKIFLLDLGIKSYFSRSFNLDKNISGNVAENFVYLSLNSSLKERHIFYYRTKAGTEIDFIYKAPEDKIDLIESKYRSNPRTGALLNFQKKYPKIVRNKIIITKNTLEVKNNIYYIPLELISFIEFNK